MFSELMSQRKYSRYFLILSYILSLAIAAVIYYTGGTNSIYADLMYIPIATAASTGGKKHGAVHAAFSGMLIGPFMINSFHAAQEPAGWIWRMIIYISISLIIGMFHDCGKKHEEHITHMLTYDPVTQLKNIQALTKTDTALGDKTVAALSVKNHDEIVSVFGYDFAAKIVLKFCKILRDELKKYQNIELYRHGGMNFILVITHEDTSENFRNLANEISEISKKIDSEPIVIDEIPIYVETLIGLSHVKNNESVLEGVRHSLTALEYANFSNIKYSIYDKTLDNRYNKIFKIAGSFRYALINNDIKIAFQNIYSSKTGRVHSAELLARWILKDGTRIYTDEFIPVIEKTKLMNELTRYMIDNAVEGIANNKFHSPISINFSAIDFNDEVIDYLISKVKENNVKNGQLQIEISERVFTYEETAVYYLNKLNKNGIAIAIDDFRAVSTSYQYINGLHFSTVKIHKTLIEKIMCSENAKNSVKSIVNFCKSRNITTVAVGLESAEIADACIEIGVDYLQGYYFHKPAII